MKFLILSMLSLTFGCQVQNDEVSTRSLDKASSDANIATPIELQLQVESQDVASGGFVTSVSAYGLISKKADQFYSVQISNRKVQKEEKLGELRIEGIGANRVIASTRALDDGGRIFDWVIFDSEGQALPKDTLLALQQQDGQVSYLEEGRQWFEAKASDIAIIFATPEFVIAKDGAFLNFIYFSAGKFSVNRVQVGLLKKVYGVSSTFMALLDDKNVVRLLEFSDKDSTKEVKNTSLEISDFERIHAIAVDLRHLRVLTFSEASNKVYDLKRNQFMKIKDYVHFGEGSETKTYVNSSGEIFSVNGEGKLQFLAIDVGGGK